MHPLLVLLRRTAVVRLLLSQILLVVWWRWWLLLLIRKQFFQNVNCLPATASLGDYYPYQNFFLDTCFSACRTAFVTSISILSASSFAFFMPTFSANDFNFANLAIMLCSAKHLCTFSIYSFTCSLFPARITLLLCGTISLLA